MKFGTEAYNVGVLWRAEIDSDWLRWVQETHKIENLVKYSGISAVSGTYFLFPFSIYPWSWNLAWKTGQFHSRKILSWWMTWGQYRSPKMQELVKFAFSAFLSHSPLFPSPILSAMDLLRMFTIWPPYGIGQAIIFLSCGFFYYLPSSFLFSSPILSRRRLDVYHTSTHGVALVRI